MINALDLINDMQELIARVEEKSKDLTREEKILVKLGLCRDLKVLVDKVLEKEKEFLGAIDKK